MTDTELMAIATGAAGTLVASMATGGAHAIRAKVAQLFSGGTQDEQTAALEAHDNDVRSLAEGARAADANPAARADLTYIEQRLVQEWARRLAAHITAHPEALSDLECLAISGTSGSSSHTGSQRNTGPGTFVGRDVIGGVHNSFNRDFQ